MLQCVRAFATFCIALFHIGFGSNYFKVFRFQASVQLFYILSAFLFMYSTQENKKYSPYSLIMKRIIRIIPLYWLLTIATFCGARYTHLIDKKWNILELIKSMFFIPFYQTSMKEGQSINPIVGPAWFLFLDAYFLIIFVIAITISHRYRGLVSCIIIICVFLFSNQFDNNSAFLEAIQSVNWFCFIAGVLLFYIVKNFWGNSNGLREHYKIVMTVIIILMALSYLKVVLWFVRIPLMTIYLSLLILLFQHQKMNKFLVRCGDISYSFYLIHYYVIIIIGKFFNLNTINIGQAISVPVILTMSYFIATLSYEIIEKRFTNFLRKICKV